MVVQNAQENVRVAKGQSCPMCNSTQNTVVAEKVVESYSWSLRRCRACGLHFTDPKPTTEFLDQFYSGDYHTELRQTGATEKAFGEKYRRYRDYLTPCIPVGGRILDIGCSTGLFVKMLCDAGFRAEGIELNTASAAWGQKEYGITIHDKPLEQCSLPEGAFNAVAMTDVLEHTLHPRDFLRSLRPYLAPNAVILITFPDIRSVESRYFYLLAKLSRRPWLWKNCHIPSHIWEFTKETAVACFEGAGFHLEAFRRSASPEYDDVSSGMERLIGAPMAPLKMPFFGMRLGTQMEFIIRKDDSWRNA